MRDPNPQAAHGGAKLAAAGIGFEHGLMEDEARELNIGFVSRVTRGRPWVRMKIAATLDGRTALANGKPVDHQPGGAQGRPPLARARLRDPHRHRHREGRRSAPDGARGRHPAPAAARDRGQPAGDTGDGADLEGGGAFVFCASIQGNDRRAETIIPANPQESRPARHAGGTARRGVNELHVEAGFRLNGSLVREGCVDEFLIYLNPSLLGDEAQGMVALPGFHCP